MKLTVKIVGVDKVNDMYGKFGDKAVQTLQKLMKFHAQEIALDAKKIARTLKIWDNGDLVRGITYRKINDLSHAILALEPYSAYHEFGTGKKVLIPDGWGTLAANFKGKGIREVNIAARPYMRPAFKSGSKFFIKDLIRELDKIAKSYE